MHAILGTVRSILYQNAGVGVKQGAQNTTGKAVDKMIDKSPDKLFNGKKRRHSGTTINKRPAKIKRTI